ncbi:agmatine deiminase [Lactobacillus terrae]|uniref:agmatine deiminase n=1 Tax=Lactobacillus terrae TaxID=2269374 RepID=UPI000C1B6DBD|nr:agmatine deiminase [Lactobacillus terrae]
MKIINSTPISDGYYLPSENIEHSESIMIWPERADNWRNGAKPAQKVFSEIANKISEYEPITMIASKEQYDHARHVLSENVRVVEMSYNDSWIKDIGPMYLLNKSNNIRSVDWRFNAWGGLVDGLYFPWDQDDKVARKISDFQRIDYYSVSDFILEGCAIHTDGEGTAILTEDTVLSEGRNGHVTKDEAEEILKNYLNLDKIIWLKSGYFMDETNGDVDNMLSFVKPGVILLTWTDDVTDPQYQISKDAFEILSHSTDAKGRKLEIHKLPIPKPLFATENESNGVDSDNGLLPRYPGDRLTASYVSYYLFNGGLLLPIFDDPNDQIAIDILKDLFPDRKIETIHARELLLGGGNVHCVIEAVPMYKE